MFTLLTKELIAEKIGNLIKKAFIVWGILIAFRFFHTLITGEEIQAINTLVYWGAMLCHYVLFYLIIPVSLVRLYKRMTGKEKAVVRVQPVKVQSFKMGAHGFNYGRAEK